MSTEALIPDFPALYYAEGITGATVRGGHTITRATAANIIALGRPARRIGPTQSLGASASYHVGYVRSHDSVKQLALAWYYWPDPDPFAALPTISITTTIRDDVGNTITSPDTIVPAGFDGTALTADRVVIYDRPVLGALGYIDLDAAAAILTGSTWTFLLRCMPGFRRKRTRKDSNLQPSVPKTDALSVELRVRKLCPGYPRTTLSGTWSGS